MNKCKKQKKNSLEFNVIRTQGKWNVVALHHLRILTIFYIKIYYNFLFSFNFFGILLLCVRGK